MKRRDKHQWMLDRINDPYFIKAKKEGYRARSAYKLIEIQKKYSIIPKNGNILDLGCAPGAWLQVLKEITKAKLYGIDLLNIDSIDNVDFSRSDILQYEEIKPFGEVIFNLILSDLAPNCSGVKRDDHFKIIGFAEFILFNIVDSYLKKGGNFSIKLFDGAETQIFLKALRSRFEKINFFKPAASHKESNEFYFVCKNFIGK